MSRSPPQSSTGTACRSTALLAELNQRSDVRGFAQTLGHLGIITATGALSWYAAEHWGWYVLALCLFLLDIPADATAQLMEAVVQRAARS